MALLVFLGPLPGLDILWTGHWGQVSGRMAEKQGLGGLFGAASGDGHYCPEGIPVELGLLSILAAFGVAFGVLYMALTIATGRRKKRSLEGNNEGVWGACEADDIQEFVGCKVENLVGSNNSFYKFADLLWHGEFVRSLT